MVDCCAAKKYLRCQLTRRHKHTKKPGAPKEIPAAATSIVAVASDPPYKNNQPSRGGSPDPAAESKLKKQLCHDSCKKCVRRSVATIALFWPRWG